MSKLCLSIAIYSLEVSTITIPFCFKETDAWYLRRIFLYFVRGGDLPVSVWVPWYPEHAAVRHSVNGVIFV